MNELKKLLTRRDDIFAEIGNIESLLRGKITTSTPVRKKDDGSTYQAGPYYKLQSWQGGKNVTRYLPPEDYPATKEYVDNYQAFKNLCDEFAEVTEQITILQDEEGVAHRVTQNRKKKPSKRSPAKR